MYLVHYVAHQSDTFHIIVAFLFIQQVNFLFCESIPCLISKLLCDNVPIYVKICPDICGSAEDDDDINATSILLSDSYMIIQQEEHIGEMVVSRVNAVL